MTPSMSFPLSQITTILAMEKGSAFQQLNALPPFAETEPNVILDIIVLACVVMQSWKILASVFYSDLQVILY